jgi:hypothetical protein
MEKIKSKLLELSTTEYTQSVLKLIKTEEDLADYFYKRSKDKIMQIIIRILIHENHEDLVKN